MLQRIGGTKRIIGHVIKNPAIRFHCFASFSTRTLRQQRQRHLQHTQHERNNNSSNDVESEGTRPSLQHEAKLEQDQADTTTSLYTDLPSKSTTTLPPSPNLPHHDLASFLTYANRSNLAQTTTVFRGTYYEYLTQLTLRRYGFQLQRVGGRADRGIDLVGFWSVPNTAEKPLKVLIQCKRVTGKGSKMGPQFVREIEGAFVGAPIGWRGKDTMGILVGTKPATKGIVTALGRCMRPMGWICLEEEAGQEEGTDLKEDGSHKGRVRQILWNQMAGQLGLEGVDVVKRYDGDGMDEVVLMYKGNIVTKPDLS